MLLLVACCTTSDHYFRYAVLLCNVELSVLISTTSVWLPLVLSKKMANSIVQNDLNKMKSTCSSVPTKQKARTITTVTVETSAK